jgi:heterotetrameric sarcosine oxidase gamma subunit
MVEIEILGLGIEALQEMHIASLRYFDSAGNFAGIVRQVLGTALPQAGQAVGARVTAPVLELLLWRSPTETWLVSADGGLIGTLSTALAAARDGCMVDQTGGISVLRLRGPRATDLLLRLGSTTSIPATGQSRTGRVAELTVTTLSIQAGETLLLVERAYADHLMAWMRATAADL